VLWNNYGELDADFNGVDITLNKRMSNRWMMMGSLSFGESLGNIYGTADLNDPNNTFSRGVVGNDMPFALKVFGQYQLPGGIAFSGSMQHFKGFPELTTVLVTAATVPLTRVSQRVTVEPRGTTRLPTVNMLDLSVRKSFKTGNRVSIEPVVDVFNATNGSAIRARSTQLGPTYGVASDVQRGRIIKLGVNMRF
jgi:outer membrane receptor protein involved in Fe transport